MGSHEYMERHVRTLCGAKVITTDASGYGGGAWGEGFAYQFFFDKGDSAPHRSSNWREFVTIKKTLQRHAATLRNQRVLVRTDNLVSMFIINKQGSMNPELNRQYQDLLHTLRHHNIDLAAAHVRGVDNDRADALSRWTRDFDDQDWMLKPAEFKRLNTTYGPFHVDACADLAGYNSHCPEYWSELEDCLKQTWSGRTVFCNPPFNNILKILKHFLHQWSLSPYL